MDDHPFQGISSAKFINHINPQERSSDLKLKENSSDR